MNSITKTKKINHLWSMLCANTAVDQKTNNLSIFNVRDQLKVDLTVKQDVDTKKSNIFPVPAPFDLISKFRKTTLNADIKFDVEIRITDPDFKELLPPIIRSVEMNSAIKNMRLITHFDVMPVTKTGVYNFEIRVKEPSETSFFTVTIVPIDIDVNIKKV